MDRIEKEKSELHKNAFCMKFRLLVGDRENFDMRGYFDLVRDFSQLSKYERDMAILDLLILTELKR